MEIKNFFKDLNQETPKIVIEKKLQDKYFQSAIFFLSNQFVEFQKNLFNEFLWELIERLSIETDSEEFKYIFEKKLQEFNSKLQIFAEKLKNIEKINIKGYIQIVIWETYLNCLIWETSTIIFRNWQLIYSVENESENWKIDIFSEIIEWTLEDGDEIITTWIKIFTYLEEKDLEELYEIARIEEKNIIDEFLEIIWSRVSISNLHFINILEIKLPSYKLQSNKKDFLWKIKKIDTAKIKNFLIQYKYPISISISIFLIIFIIYAFFNLILTNWNKKNKIIIHSEKWIETINCLPSDISKEIDLFQKIPADSPKKNEKYKQILNQIKQCKAENLFVNELNKLEKILTKTYYSNFNIIIIDHWWDKLLTSIPSKQFKQLWKVLYFYYNGKFFIGWSSGSIINFVNKNLPGKFVNYNLPIKINWCKYNLLWNWLYCWTKEGNIFNITKIWLKSVISTSWFPTNITNLSQYLQRRLFIITNEKKLNDKGIYIIRYDNLPWTQTKFKNAIYYPFEKKYFEKEKNNFTSGFSDIEVDNSNWTFLAWSKKNKQLYQFRRPSGYYNNINLVWRNIPLNWWPTFLNPLSDNIKIFVFDQNNKYGNRIYLYDKTNKQLRIYKSRPYKSSVDYSRSYKLYYDMMFDLKNIDPVDVSIQLIKKPILYILDRNWNIYKIDISIYADFLEK